MRLNEIKGYSSTEDVAKRLLDLFQRYTITKKQLQQKGFANAVEEVSNEIDPIAIEFYRCEEDEQAYIRDYILSRLEDRVSESVDNSKYVLGKKPNPTKEYGRQGGNGQHYKWKITLNNGKVKYAWADRGYTAKMTLGTNDKIIGVRRMVRVKQPVDENFRVNDRIFASENINNAWDRAHPLYARTGRGVFQGMDDKDTQAWAYSYRDEHNEYQTEHFYYDTKFETWLN